MHIDSELCVTTSQSSVHTHTHIMCECEGEFVCASINILPSNIQCIMNTQTTHTIQCWDGWRTAAQSRINQAQLQLLSCSINWKLWINFTFLTNWLLRGVFVSKCVCVWIEKERWYAGEAWTPGGTCPPQTTGWRQQRRWYGWGSSCGGGGSDIWWC